MSKNRSAAARGRRAWLLVMAVLGAVAIAACGALDRNGWGVLPSRAAGRLSAVRISEVQSDNSMTLPELSGTGWIELENTGDEPVSLRGLCLTRDGKLNKTLVFPDVDLEPGAFLLVYADRSLRPGGDDALHAPFSLPRSGAHALCLYDEAANLIDSVDIPVMKTDEAYCRDAAGAWAVTVKPTPGKPNDVADQFGGRLVQGDVTLNELMCSNVVLFPDEDGEVYDYVELINLGSAPVDLADYRLTDDVNKPDKWRFPSVTLPAGGVLAVHCSGKNRRSGAHLHTSFRLSEGETVYLFQPNGDLASMASLSGLEKGKALSRTDSGEWTADLLPTPNRENTREAALALDGENRAARAGGVYISEIMALPGGETQDWVELYNDGDAAVDLGGWGFSDSLKKARKWQFPAGTRIAAHGFMAVAMTGGDAPGASGYAVAPFTLPGAGGYTLSLCEPTGRIVDCLYVPEQYSGISFGRTDDGACGYFEKPTPMKANGNSISLGRAYTATYSVGGGLHAKGDKFEVALSAEPGARIYYTLDCSDPSDKKTLYDGTPISIGKTTILRTRVYKDGFMPSLTDTQSYLFDVNAATEVPYVISLVSDPKNLTSSRTGIMVLGKYRNIWQEWKREAHVEVFAEGREPVISQACDIKLHGRNTRGYQLKSFKVMASRKYGSKMFDYPLFHDRPYDSYEAFILRYSGQDYKYTFMRDVVMTGLAANTSVMYMEAEECIVYLNGKYYSAMYMRENVSPFSLARREGWEGQEASLDLVKSDYDIKQGSDETYLALNEFLKHHDANTQEVYDRIDAEVDIDNFIEFATMYVVFCPPDTVNVKRYRNKDADGKWRWVLYDLDRGLRGGADSGNGFKLMSTGVNGPLFRAFMKNDRLRERFLDNLNKALGSYLSSQSMHDAVMAQFERIRPVLPDYLDNLDLSQAHYKSLLESLLDNVALRPSRVLKHCAGYFNFTESQMRERFPDAIAAIEAYSR